MTISVTFNSIQKIKQSGCVDKVSGQGENNATLPGYRALPYTTAIANASHRSTYCTVAAADGCYNHARRMGLDSSTEC